jgi:hypothetical protein
VFRWMAGVLESQLEEMAVELAGVYRKTLGGYERLTERDVQRCTRAVLRVVVAQLRSGERPGEREREELLALAGGWAEAGLDVDTTARAFQIGARHLIGVVREQVAQDDAAAVEAFSASVDLAWEWSLLSGEVLSEVQRERTLRQARRDVNLRAEFLRDLAGGRVSPERLADAADAYGLDLELPYVTTCALAASSAVASRLEVELRFSGSCWRCVHAPPPPRRQARWQRDRRRCSATRPPPSPRRAMCSRPRPRFTAPEWLGSPLSAGSLSSPPTTGSPSGSTRNASVGSTTAWPTSSTPC